MYQFWWNLLLGDVSWIQGSIFGQSRKHLHKLCGKCIHSVFPTITYIQFVPTRKLLIWGKADPAERNPTWKLALAVSWRHFIWRMAKQWMMPNFFISKWVPQTITCDCQWLCDSPFFLLFFIKEMKKILEDLGFFLTWHRKYFYFMPKNSLTPIPVITDQRVIQLPIQLKSQLFWQKYEEVERKGVWRKW